MRRVLHRLLAATAVVVAAVATPAAPALAADRSLRLHFPDIAVAADSAKINPLFALIDVPGDQGSAPASIGKLTVSVETAGVSEIASVAAVDLDSDTDDTDDQSCGRAGTVITCTIDGPLVLDPGTQLLPLLALQVTGKSGAAQEASGKLVFTARADGDPVVTAESTVTLGEGVDLSGFIAKPQTVAAGATVATELRLANVGAKPVKGVVLVMVGWNPSLIAGEGFANCRYGILTLCTFDDELATGTTYELSTPMRVRIPSDAAAGSRASVLGGWYTPSDFKELLDIVPQDGQGEILGPKGTGPAVRLQAVPVPKSAARAAANQVDTDPSNNALTSEIVVAGGRQPDVAAVGATVSGAAGDRVRARVGFVNKGPGTLYHWTFDNTDPMTHVLVPPGLLAVKHDHRCFAMPTPVVTESGDESEPPDDTNSSDYLCSSSGGKTKAKASTLFDFTFEVRDDASDAPGQVRIDDDVVAEGGLLDSDARDNAAKIEVRLSGGSGGGLAVTGANAGLLGAGGAALLVAGGLGLLLARRRRTRFSA